MLYDILKQQCACLTDMKEADFASLFSKFVRYLSSITCWNIRNDETILVQSRIDVRDVDLCGCNKCIEITPYYKNLVDTTLKVSIRQYTSEGVTIVDVPNVFYDDLDDKVLITLPKTALDCACGCKRNVLVMEYDAGFNLDTDDWIDILCHYFTAYTALANQCVTVDECCNNNMLQIGSRLKSKKVGEISYTWEQDPNTIEYINNQLFMNHWRNRLGKYSLCGRNEQTADFIYVKKGNR